MTREYKVPVTDAQQISIPADVLDQIAKDVTEFNRQQATDFRTMQLITKIFNLLDKGVETRIGDEYRQMIGGMMRALDRVADAEEMLIVSAYLAEHDDLRPNAQARRYFDRIKDKWTEPTT